ncbi:MAG: soluble NSF attachment family protein [Clostridiales bacterium]|nr:soluble NSF attachment family protein [Clostridiales bacterium]
MRIDLNCPAEVAGAELASPEKDWIRLILMNLTDRAIDSCEATVRILNREGAELGRTVHRARTLRGRPHSAFSMPVPMELPPEAVRAEAMLDKVWFEDHDVWRRDPAKEREYEPNLLPPGNDLNALRYVAGDTAAGFPSQQAGVWVCVCGRPNANSDAVCVRCRRRKDMIFQLYQRDAVLRQVSQRERQLDLQTRGVREETAQMQRMREAEYEQKMSRRSRRKRLGIALAAALLLAAGFIRGVEPALRLWSADAAIRAGRLEDARETLKALGSFPGAADRLEETETGIARRDGEAAAEDPEAFSAERMAEISGRLRGAGNGAEDPELADRVDLARARKLLKEGKETEAEALLASLPEDTEGREQLMRDCAFARAERAMAERDFETARSLYLSLGDYPGAAKRAKDALYEPALAMMEAGEYEQAIAAFTEAGDYLDSKALIQQCWYLKGVVLSGQGEAAEARQAYLAAGDYEDAAEQAQKIQWMMAEDLLAAKDYGSALPIYREMDGYEDARDKWILCATELARASYRQREYMQAASWLEDLPEDTRDTRQIRTRALFLGAKAMANRGDLENAITTMERVADYGDAGRSLRSWRVTLARQYMEEKKYAEAREILTPVEEYYNARQLLKELDKLEAAEKEEKTETGNGN